MKKLFLFLLPILAWGMVSCDTISPEAKTSFIGEYWMETSSVAMKGDVVVDSTVSTKWSPVKIYEEDGQLFVRTNWYGAPYLSDDTAHAEIAEEYKTRPDFISPRRLLAEDGESDITDVVVNDNKPIMIVQNGQIYVIRNGEYWKSEPIKVKSGSTNVLNLEKFTPVYVPLTDGSGTYLGSVKCTYKYGPMVKKDDVVTWQVELLQEDFSISDYIVDRIVHTNTLYKR